MVGPQWTRTQPSASTAEGRGAAADLMTSFAIRGANAQVVVDGARIAAVDPPDGGHADNVIFSNRKDYC